MLLTVTTALFFTCGTTHEERMTDVISAVDVTVRLGAAVGAGRHVGRFPFAWKTHRSAVIEDEERTIEMSVREFLAIFYDAALELPHVRKSVLLQ